MDYMFTFFEWHTQHLLGHWMVIWYCLWTICLLFLNDIHNRGVPGVRIFRLFMDYMFTFFEWHTQRYENRHHRPHHCLWTICLLFWMTYTTMVRLDITSAHCLWTMFYFFWMTYTTRYRITAASLGLFMYYVLLFLNDEQNLFFIHNLQFFLVLDRISNSKGSDY